MIRVSSLVLTLTSIGFLATAQAAPKTPIDSIKKSPVVVSKAKSTQLQAHHTSAHKSSKEQKPVKETVAAKKPTTGTAHKTAYSPSATSGEIMMTGAASYYGPGFHGRLTANGERFNMHALTAAHKSLPFGTKLKVTNLANGKSVIVRINDRGPYVGARILDLSVAAAKEIGIIHSGVGRVSVARAQ